jgi:hypothetical protein
MGEIKMDLALKACIESGTTLTFSGTDDAEVLSNPWGNAPVVKSTGQSSDDGAFDISDPVGQMFSKAARNVDQPVEVWEEPIVPTSFEERSQQRFQKMCSVITKVFGDHAEEREKAIVIAKRALAEARAEAEVIAAA